MPDTRILIKEFHPIAIYERTGEFLAVIYFWVNVNHEVSTMKK